MKRRRINSRIGVAVLALAAANFGVATSSYGQFNGRGVGPQQGTPAVNRAEEEAAYKAFDNEGNPDAKIELGEDFDRAYPTSGYQKSVDSIITLLYYNKGDWADFFATGHKVIAEDPDNVPILELVGWVIPRQYNSADPSESAKLDESEKYEKHALSVIAAMKKPKAVTKDQFNNAQASLAWRAHGGLGMTYFRRKDFANSVKELEIAVTEESPETDPVDLYILGVDLQNLNRTSEAVDAFTKCSQILGGLQDRCRKNMDSAMKPAPSTPALVPEPQQGAAVTGPN
jgi:tetratricopeptide (TPR) repeat protein